MFHMSHSIGSAIRWVRQRGHERLAFGLEVCIEAAHEIFGARTVRTAAALAFTSILALVPLLAVSFSVLRLFVTESSLAQQVRELILRTLLADSVAGINEYLERFLEASQSGTVGLVGLTVLLFTSIALFLSMEGALNRIWRVRPSRPLYRRVTTFYAVITLTPALMALGSIGVDWILKSLEAVSMAATFGGFVSFFTILVGLTLLYQLMPHTSVRWRNAILGGVYATVVFQVSRWAFNLYVESVYTGSVTAKIYGTFALVPIFFFWVHMMWLIILSGAAVTYMLQNKERLVWNIHRRRTGQRGDSPVSPRLVSQVFAVIAEVFYRQGGGTSIYHIAQTLNREEAEIEDAVSLLHQSQLVVQVTESDRPEIIPARPLEKILVTEVMTLARSTFSPHVPAQLSILHTLDGELLRAQSRHDDYLAGHTFLDLLKEGR